jgi:hypothetical protein
VFAVRRIPAYVAFLLVGFAGGWLFELFKIQTEVTAQSGRALTELEASVQTLTRKITYQDQALGMLVSAPRHTEALTGADQGVRDGQVPFHPLCRRACLPAPVESSHPARRRV